jgi:hypothetical protein
MADIEGTQRPLPVNRDWWPSSSLNTPFSRPRLPFSCDIRKTTDLEMASDEIFPRASLGRIHLHRSRGMLRRPAQVPTSSS